MLGIIPPSGSVAVQTPLVARAASWRDKPAACDAVRAEAARRSSARAGPQAAIVPSGGRSITVLHRLNPLQDGLRPKGRGRVAECEQEACQRGGQQTDRVGPSCHREGEIPDPTRAHAHRAAAPCAHLNHHVRRARQGQVKM